MSVEYLYKSNYSTVARGAANYDSGGGGEVLRKGKCLIGFGERGEGGGGGGGGNLCRVRDSKEMDRVSQQNLDQIIYLKFTLSDIIFVED